MQKLQLYIEGVQVELFKDENVTITDTLKNTKQVDAIFTEYSRTFSLPASKTNNKIFKHYYNDDIVNGFDARIRIPSNIELNDLPFKDGYIKLEGVDLRNNVAYTYKITFFGNTISLKNAIGDDLISDLSWLNNFNNKQSGVPLIYNSTDVKDYLTTSHDKTVDGVSYVNPLQVPLVTHTQRLYYNSAESLLDTGNLYVHPEVTDPYGVKWNELKFAIKLPIIIKAIEENYDIQFSTDFFNTSNLAWDDLYMWLHRVKGQPTNGGQVVSSTAPVIGWADSSVPLFSSMTNNSLWILNSTANTVTLTFTPSTADLGDNYSYTVFDNNTIYQTVSNVQGVSAIVVPMNTGISSNFTVEVTSSVEIDFDSVTWTIVNTTIGTTTYINTNFIKTDVFGLVITQQVPKMKVMDFLTSIFKMFNLVAYVDNGIIIVKTYDDFYGTYVDYDITKYLDVSKSQSNVALPFREIIFAYSGLKTYLAQSHNQITNENWGTIKYNQESTVEFSGNIYNYTTPFEHMKFERLVDIDSPTPPTNIQWGYCVDDNQESFIGEPIIFYMNRKAYSPADPIAISFVDSVTPENVALSNVAINNYFAPCNSNMNVSVFANQSSINFAAEADEWTGDTNLNTLFQDYHSSYITSVFNTKNRITKATAFLPLKILLNYTLNDRFIITGTSYKINSITTNFGTGKSNLELLNDL